MTGLRQPIVNACLLTAAMLPKQHNKHNRQQLTNCIAY